MIKQTLRNGEVIDAEIASDRSLLYGDGIFTTIAVRDYRPALLQHHLDRLLNDGKRLNITGIPIDDIKDSLFSLCQDLEQAVIRITVSRGSGVRGYFCQDVTPVFWITVSEWPDHIDKYRKQGINLRICSQKLSYNPELAGIKHCNRLEQVMARNEWDTELFQEGIMLDREGNVIEGTMSNLFLIKNGQIYTPDLTGCGVNGIIRKTVIELVENLGISLKVTTLNTQDLQEADAVFVSNSIIGLWPVNRLNNKQFTGDPIIQQLSDELGKQIGSTEHS